MQAFRLSLIKGDDSDRIRTGGIQTSRTERKRARGGLGDARKDQGRRTPPPRRSVGCVRGPDLTNPNRRDKGCLIAEDNAVCRGWEGTTASTGRRRRVEEGAADGTSPQALISARRWSS